MNKILAIFDLYKERIVLRLYFKKLRQFNNITLESQYLRSLPADIIERMALCSFRSQGYKISPATQEQKKDKIKAHVTIKNRTYPLFIHHPKETQEDDDLTTAIEACHALKKRGLFISTHTTDDNIKLLHKNRDVLESLTGQLLQDLLVTKPKNISQTKFPLYGAYALGIIALTTVMLYVSSITYFLLNKWVLSFATIRPWSILQYLSYTHSPYGENLLISLLLPLIVTGGLVALYIFKPNDKSSRWATLSDIKKARMLDDKGILLGKFKGKYLRNNDPTHCFTFAPTGSGKGVNA